MKHCLIALTSILIIAGCSEKKSDSRIIEFKDTSSSDLFFTEIVEEIELIPLETYPECIIGQSTELVVLDDSYFVVDKMTNQKVFRFDREGKYLNTIGRLGRGEGEYIGFNDFKIKDNRAIIQSSYETMLLFYDLTGEYIDKQSFDFDSMQFQPLDEGYLFYTGYGMGDDVPRLIYVDKSGNHIESYLLETPKVIHMGELYPVFSLHGSSIFIRETYNRELYKFDENSKSLASEYEFNLGKYAISDEFFKFSDSFKAMEFLFEREFAIINRFIENEKYSLCEVIINNPKKHDSNGRLLYAIQNKEQDRWIWQYFGEIEKSVFTGSFRTFSDNKLYAVIDAATIKTINSKERAKIINQEILDSISEDDNQIIAVISLK